MAKCSRGHCTMPAELGRKPNLCKFHHADRDRKREATFALPECSMLGCRQRTKHEFCASCAREVEEQRQEQDHKDWIRDQLRECKTLEELKDFIEGYVL